MLSEEVNFKLLEFVQTVDGTTFSIGFLGNENQKTLSKKIARSMYIKGQIRKN